MSFIVAAMLGTYMFLFLEEKQTGLMKISCVAGKSGTQWQNLYIFNHGTVVRTRLLFVG